MKMTLSHNSFGQQSMQEFLIDPDDFIQVKPIGKGGCGDVFLWRNKYKTNDFCAAKRIRRLPTGYKDQISFMREITIPLKLNLKGIVRLVGYTLPSSDGNKEAEAYILTEFMPNGTLKKVLEENCTENNNPNFGPTEYSKAAFGIAATMMHVHKKNIMHRDLKPENVFLDSDYEPRIADFGLSKVMKEDVMNTLQIGTPIFMAPELINGEQTNSDLSVDVYAYGVLLYQMFTHPGKFTFDDGTVPSKKTTYHAIFNKICRGVRFMRDDRIPDHFWDLITRCWDGAALKRPTFEEIVETLKDERFTWKNTDIEEWRTYKEKILRVEQDDTLASRTKGVARHYNFKEMAYYPPK